MEFRKRILFLFRQHGKWINLAHGKQQCNNCQKIFTIITKPYAEITFCPYCGSINSPKCQDWFSLRRLIHIVSERQ